MSKKFDLNYPIHHLLTSIGISCSRDLVESESPLPNRPSYFRTASLVDKFAMQSENAAESLLSDGRDLHAVVRQPQITTCPVVSHPRCRSYVGIRRE